MAWWGSWRSHRESSKFRKNLDSYAAAEGFTVSEEPGIFTLSKTLDELCVVKVVVTPRDDGMVDVMEVWHYDGDGTDDESTSVAQDRGVFITGLSEALGRPLGGLDTPRTRVGDADVQQGILDGDEFVEPDSWYADLEWVRRRVQSLEDMLSEE